MTRAARRYLVALVGNTGSCKWCGRMLPERWMDYCNRVHHGAWVREQDRAGWITWL